MEQKEYDEQMRMLNMQLKNELDVLSEQLDSISKKRFELKSQINKLKSDEIETGSQYYDICGQIKSVKQKYSRMKQELFYKRPEKQ